MKNTATKKQAVPAVKNSIRLILKVSGANGAIQNFSKLKLIFAYSSCRGFNYYLVVEIFANHFIDILPRLKSWDSSHASLVVIPGSSVPPFGNHARFRLGSASSRTFLPALIRSPSGLCQPARLTAVRRTLAATRRSSCTVTVQPGLHRYPAHRIRYVLRRIRVYVPYALAVRTREHPSLRP